MLLAIYKEIIEALEKRFWQFAEYKADCHPEVFLFDWDGLKEILKTAEDDLIWDYDLRDVLLAIVNRLLQYLQDRGFIYFSDFMNVTKRILEYYRIQSESFALQAYMDEIKISKDQLDGLFITPC